MQVAVSTLRGRCIVSLHERRPTFGLYRRDQNECEDPIEMNRCLREVSDAGVSVQYDERGMGASSPSIAALAHCQWLESEATPGFTLKLIL